jgi:hypothetical protein
MFPQNPETPAERNVRIVSEQGVPHPRAVVEILKPFDEQTAAGPMPFAIVGGQVVPLATAVTRFREENPGLARLYNPNGKLDVEHMPPEHFRAIRAHSPELFGLDPIKRARW